MPGTLPATDRNFIGYAHSPSPRRWPDGKRLAVSVVVNVEEGAELALGMGDEANEHVYEAVERVEGVRDLCMESHYEYGTRVGWGRIRASLKVHGVHATFNACGRAIAYSPWIAKEAVADGHEVSAHGWRWERQVYMDEATERAAIARTVEAIAAAAGTPPVGWHTRSATSPNTRRLLVEHGGFIYDSNAYNDDTPYTIDLQERRIDLQERRHVVLPYAFDTNDIRFANSGGFVFGDDFARYCIDAFERLYSEGVDSLRMMSIGPHLRIIGKAGRIGGLDRLLAHIAARDGVWFARRDEIARAWIKG